MLLQYSSCLFINNVYPWLRPEPGILHKIFRIRKFVILRMIFVPRNSGENTKLITHSIQSVPVKYKRHMKG